MTKARKEIGVAILLLAARCGAAHDEKCAEVDSNA